MIKEYIEAKYGFKVHTAYIAEVKRDLGLPMYDDKVIWIKIWQGVYVISYIVFELINIR